MQSPLEPIGKIKTLKTLSVTAPADGRLDALEPLKALRRLTVSSAATLDLDEGTFPRYVEHLDIEAPGKQDLSELKDLRLLTLQVYGAEMSNVDWLEDADTRSRKRRSMR